MSNGQAFNLDSVGATVLPVIALGAQRIMMKTETSSWSLSLAGEAGYTTQETKVKYISGLSPSDTRLSTGTVAMVVGAHARFLRFPSLEWRGGWIEGMMTTSHSAPDNAVNFTQQGRFRGPRLGMSYWPNALVALDLNAETLSNTLETQSGSVSLGTRVTW